jgi:hypothetical protein
MIANSWKILYMVNTGVYIEETDQRLLNGSALETFDF